MRRYIIWRWEVDDRGESTKEVFWNGVGWTVRSGAKRYSEGEAEQKKRRLPGSMVRRV